MAALGSAADNVAAAISTLEQYSACDVSDVLLKLGVPGAGFLPDLVLLSASSSARNQQQQQQHHHTRPTVAAASTVLFVPKHPVEEERQEQPKEQYPPGNIANDMHWADLTVPGTIVVIKQPEGQKNAVCGGIMALRLAMLGAKGIVVLGRARDVAELRDTGLPVWALGTSTVGAGLASTARCVQVPITHEGVTVSPGDIIVADPPPPPPLPSIPGESSLGGGVVVIPRDRLNDVLALLPRLVAADEKVRRDVAEGNMSVAEAFRVHRKGL